MISDLKKNTESRMNKTVGSLTESLQSIRAGRANTTLLDKIHVDYYGQKTPINQVASLSAPEPRLLAIQPWDANLIPDIEKAILKSDLGITPSNDGKIIRLAIPQLTEERRRDLTKLVGKYAEEAKISIRNVRRDAMEDIKKAEKAKEISEDDKASYEEDIQKLTDKYIKEVDKVAENKEKELMEIWFLALDYSKALFLRSFMNYYEELDLNNIPKHVGIIMDGNGRWAKNRNMPRTFGHKEGTKRVIEIVEAAYKINIKSLTLYAFSTENWKRPEEEISKLMDLLAFYIKSQLEKIKKNNVRIKVLGDYRAFPDPIVKLIEDALQETKSNDKMILNIGLNYGGQSEIVRASKNICKDIIDGKISLDDIDTESFKNYLYTTGQDDLDLLIRPSGELRVSNFLLYQLAYSEFYFSNILWPDFHENDFYKAIYDFQKRNRRYGGL